MHQAVSEAWLFAFFIVYKFDHHCVIFPGRVFFAYIHLNGICHNSSGIKQQQVLEKGEYLVRIYVIKGINLQPHDFGGLSDPYICIKLGKKTVVNDEENYIPNELNPVFGK